jgi:hypothetical protein
LPEPDQKLFDWRWRSSVRRHHCKSLNRNCSIGGGEAQCVHTIAISSVETVRLEVEKLSARTPLQEPLPKLFELKWRSSVRGHHCQSLTRICSIGGGEVQWQTQLPELEPKLFDWRWRGSVRGPHCYFQCRNCSIGGREAQCADPIARASAETSRFLDEKSIEPEIQ